jgi:hypothetical protein
MYAQNVKQTVVSLRFGAPVRDGALCILPLRGTVSVDARYVLLEQAITRGRMVITEVNEAGSVPYLQAVNKGPWPVLIFDGEELVGAKQNRIANATILVDVGKTVLPVSCVEQGRWSHRSQAFDSGSYVSHVSLRQAKERQVRASMAAEAPLAAAAQQVRATRYRSDQGRVWAEVARSSRSLGVDSPTMAMADTHKAGGDDLDRTLQALSLEKLGPVDEVVGVIVFVGGRFVCLDLLQPAKRFALIYPKLLRGYALEARLYKGDPNFDVTLNCREPLDHRLASRRGAGQVPVDFDPEAAALRLFADTLEASVQEQPGVDLGTDLRLESKQVSGAGLVWQDAVLQLSVFPKAGA